MKHIYTLIILAIYFFTPFESVALGEDFSIVKFVVILLVLFSLFNLKNFNFRAKSRFIPLILMYFVFCFLSVFWSIAPADTFSFFTGKIIPCFILTILLLWSIDSIEMINKISWSYILGTFIVCIIAYVNFKTYIGESGFRNTALEQDQNELGFLINMGIVFTLYLLGNYDNKKIKILLWAFIAIFAFTVLSTGSRTGFVVMLLILGVWLMGRKIKRFIPYLVIFFAITILCITIVPAEIFERLLETREQVEAGDFTGRGDIWKNGLMAWEKKDVFVFGTGYNTWGTLYGAEYGYRKAPHNSYIQTLVELGIVGLFFFLSIFIFLFKKAWYLCKKYDTVYLLFILPLLVVMTTLGTNGRRWVFLFGILIVKFVEYQKLINNNNNNNNNNK